MKKLVAGLAITLLLGTLVAQDVSLLILGEKVNGYQAPQANAPVLTHFSSETAVTGHRLDDHWYQVKGPDGGESFVWAWDVIESSMVEPGIDLNPKRITPSAETLFRMMKYFKQSEKTDKAVEFALRIITNHSDEEFPTEEAACYKLGHLAYMYLISTEEEGVVYDDFLFAFASKVLEETEVPAVLAMAHYHLARFQAINGAPDKAMDNLLMIVKSYPTVSSINECQPEDPNSAYYKPERTKRLFCALSMIQPASALLPVREQLQVLINESENEDSRAMALELSDNLGSMPYAREESVWN